MRSKPLCSSVCVKFDDPKATNSLKYRRLSSQFKEYVPIIAAAKRFPLNKGKGTVIAETKQISRSIDFMQNISQKSLVEILF